MSAISEEEVKCALLSIFDQLDDRQYRKMLYLLVEIPQSRKESKNRQELTQILIEFLGEEGAIRKIAQLMLEIPRKDATIQNILRPLLDKLDNKEEQENRGSKRKHEEASLQEVNKDAAGPMKDNTARYTNSNRMEGEAASVSQRRCRPEQETKTHESWMKTIHDLKSSKQILNWEAFVGKVVRKSELMSYPHQKKGEMKYFDLAVADHTDSIKLTVYHEKNFKQIKEEKSYLFRMIAIRGDYFMVTKDSRVSETSAVDIPAHIQNAAQTLIYPKETVFSIKEIETFPDGRDVNVRGVVTEIFTAESVKVSYQKEKKAKQAFQLKDGTGSIEIVMWGDNTKHCEELQSGDIIMVTNLRTEKYRETTKLKSTVRTTINKIDCANIPNKRIKIIAINQADKSNTHLETEVNHQLQGFDVSSQLLANEFGIPLDDDFHDKLVEKLPLWAEVETQGAKIKTITAVQDI